MVVHCCHGRLRQASLVHSAAVDPELSDAGSVPVAACPRRTDKKVSSRLARTSVLIEC